MANKKRLIDANAIEAKIEKNFRKLIANQSRPDLAAALSYVGDLIIEAPTVDAVEVSDKELRKAINLLIKQYEHSKNSDYVHSPVAHAFYYTWKQLDDGRRE